LAKKQKSKTKTGHIFNCQKNVIKHQLPVHITLSGRGSNLSLGPSAYQRIISDNSYEHDERGNNPGQEKRGSTMSSINCDRC